MSLVGGSVGLDHRGAYRGGDPVARCGRDIDLLAEPAKDGGLGDRETAW